MHRNMDLYKYLITKAEKLTDDWYKSIDQSTAVGVYASKDAKDINRLKSQNYSFHEHLIQVFLEDEHEFFKAFEVWLNEIVTDNGHQSTPTHIILQEFLNVQRQYLSMIESFERENEGTYTKEQIYSWNHIILKAFSRVMTRFVEVHDQLSLRRLKSQQELINDLSAPVIKLHQDVGLLPVVGEIDTQRAKYLLENTLMECTKKCITHLYVDLSGVNVIDTMVAMQIFQLIDALKIVGVKTTLSGVRPEIALTAVHLGLNFKDIHIAGNLSQALQMK